LFRAGIYVIRYSPFWEKVPLSLDCELV
jgi:hypothetical protein